LYRTFINTVLYNKRKDEPIYVRALTNILGAVQIEASLGGNHKKKLERL
jgi:hypothetical protein